MPSGDTSGSAIFSGRREGFAIYFARLVRPIWKDKVTKSGCVNFNSPICMALTVVVQISRVAGT